MVWEWGCWMTWNEAILCVHTLGWAYQTCLSTIIKSSVLAAKNRSTDSPGERKTFWKPNSCFSGAPGTWRVWICQVESEAVVCRGRVSINIAGMQQSLCSFLGLKFPPPPLITSSDAVLCKWRWERPGNKAACTSALATSAYVCSEQIPR